MNRRNFLQLLYSILILPLSPINATRGIKAGPLISPADIMPEATLDKQSYGQGKFRPNYEYGRVVQIKGLNDQKIIKFLHDDAKRVLPRGTPYELRVTIYIPGSHVYYPSAVFGPKRMVACWYYSPIFLGMSAFIATDFSIIWKKVDSKPYKKAGMVRPDSWGEWNPAYGCWVRGTFYA